MRLTLYVYDIPREPLAQFFVNLGQIPALGGGCLEGDRWPTLGKTGKLYWHIGFVGVENSGC